MAVLLLVPLVLASGGSFAHAAPAGTVSTMARGLSAPLGIAVGSDGNVWFANSGNASVGRITPSGDVTTFALPAVGYVTFITAGPDGALWFTTTTTVGRITTSGSVTTFATPNLVPYGITAGPDGNLWFTSVSSIGRITPGGVITSFTGPGVNARETITTGPDGNLWFTNFDSIGRITPSGVVTSYVGGNLSTPHGITTGPDGNLWFANHGNDTIGSITPAGTITNYPAPGAAAQPHRITTGPDGNLWFTNQGNSSIGRITPTGAATSYLGDQIHEPSDIVSGPGGLLWFTNGNSIGTISTTGTISNHIGPGIDRPRDITTGPDGNIWFTNEANNSIGRSTATGVVSNFGGAGVASPRDITRGPDGNMWFTNHGDDSIGRITPTGTITAYTDPSINAPRSIVPGPDGNLWFTNHGSNSIGRITPTGTITAYTDPTISAPRAIASGPDGNLWFTNEGNNSIGRITPTGTVTNHTDPSFGGLSLIIAGPDESMWFIDSGRMRRITPVGGISTVHDAIGSPEDMALGRDGNVWMTLTYGVVSLTPSGVVSGSGGPAVWFPIGIGAGPDGAMWFTNANNTLARVTTGLGAPTNPVAVAGDRQATVSWSAPPSDGDSPITGYTVTATPGGNTCQWSSGPLSCTLSGLTAGLAYTFAVTATNGDGVGPPSPPSNQVSPTGAGSRFVGMTPKRVVDTRVGIGGPQTRWGPGESRTINVAGGTTTVPAGATSVVLNVTGVNPSATTHLTVWPTGEPMPGTSLVNLPPGTTRANLVELRVGAGGQVSLANNEGTTDVVVDVVGYDAPDPAGGSFTAVSPHRILDSRDGTGGFDTPWPEGEARDVRVRSGTTTVPADATAVVVNLTAVNASATTHITVWPAGDAMPVASNLNVAAGVATPNLVAVKIGADDAVSVYNNSGTTDLVADVVGFYAPGSGGTFTGVSPARLLDTRTQSPPQLWPGGTLDLTVVGGSVGGGRTPTDATTVVLNLTGIGPGSATHLTVWPAGETKPVASNLNLPAGDVRANLVVVKVGLDGRVSIYNNEAYPAIAVDVVGFYR